jgi:UDPglucose 6-dehydrogenase
MESAMEPVSLRLTVIGIGYLGLTHAVCMAEIGHDVLAFDIDSGKIAKAANGEVPFYEPGLEPLLRKHLELGRLRFTDSIEQVAIFGQVHFVCVGTPQGRGGEADLSYLRTATEELTRHLTGPNLIVGKSTVPPGTARELAGRMRQLAPANPEIELAWNPEFLREGFAVADSLRPDRLVFGVDSDGAAELLRAVFEPLLAAGVPALFLDLETAELVKISANAFLAMKVSFINAMAEVCEAVGADVTALAEALRYDERIGSRFLAPGLGFGGGCLPKDIRAFGRAAEHLGVESVAELLGTVDAVNQGRRAKVIELARKAVGGSLDGKRVAVLGVSFKPNTDDIRDSPSLDVCERLLGEGAIVSAHDPVALPNAARANPALRCADSVCDAADGAEVVLHLTEWSDYQAIDPQMLAKVVHQRCLVDARCALDVGSWRAAGWDVTVLGRP